MSRLEHGAATCALLFVAVACEQLGNPEQLTTGPTVWKAGRHELVTTTHSFRNPKTVRRLVADGLEDLDYADPSIGPDQTLTIVTVAPRRLRPIRPGAWLLVTEFELEGRRPIARRWRASAGRRQWTAAFALPSTPVDAVTYVAP